MSDFSCYGGASDEWLAIEKTLPPVSNDFDIMKLKKATNEGREALAAEEMRDMVSKITIRDHGIPTRDGSVIEGRSYRSKMALITELTAVYIHLHGGGFVFGTLSSEDAICTRIALTTSVLVFNVNYRHTPEFTYPTAWHDAQDAFEWVHSHTKDFNADPDKIIVGGISAGAWLAASLTLEQHLSNAVTSCPKIAGQVLMIPSLVHMDCYAPQLEQLASPEVSSYVENKDAPILPLHRARIFTDALKVTDPDVHDTMLNPGNARPDQVLGLPPTVFGVAGLDPLRDEALLYANKLNVAG